jgi:hypothetical protein
MKSRSVKSRGEKSEPLDPGTGGSLDQGLIACIVHSEVRRLRGPLLDIKSHGSVESQGTSEGHVVEPQGGAHVVDRWTHVVWRKERQCSVDFSRLGDSRSKSTGAQPFDLQRCE